MKRNEGWRWEDREGAWGEDERMMEEFGSRNDGGGCRGWEGMKYMILRID